MNKAYHVIFNIFITFFITFLSMSLSIVFYYRCSIIEGIQRIFMYDLFTLLYFVLLWLTNYVFFDILKMVADIHDQNIIKVIGILYVISGWIFLYIPILDVFQYNILLSFLLILIRSCIKKDQKFGLK